MREMSASIPHSTGMESSLSTTTQRCAAHLASTRTSLTRCMLMQRLWGRQGKDALLSHVRRRDEVRLIESLRTATDLRGQHQVTRQLSPAKVAPLMAYISIILVIPIGTISNGWCHRDTCGCPVGSGY